MKEHMYDEFDSHLIKSWNIYAIGHEYCYKQSEFLEKYEYWKLLKWTGTL